VSVPKRPTSTTPIGVDATIEIAAGAFRGEVDATLCTEDFARFRDEIRPARK
jgi:hypothetical protein